VEEKDRKIHLLRFSELSLRLSLSLPDHTYFD